jgi:hypothetical protein
MSSDSVQITVELIAQDLEERLKRLNQKLEEIRVSTVEGAQEATTAVNIETQAYAELEAELEQVLQVLERLKEVGNGLPPEGIKIIANAGDLGGTIKLLAEAAQGTFFFLKTVKLLKDSKDPIGEVNQAIAQLTSSIGRIGETTPALKGLKDQLLLTSGGAKELAQALSTDISGKLNDKLKDASKALADLNKEAQKVGNNIANAFEEGAIDAEFFDGSIKELNKNLAATSAKGGNLKPIEQALKNAGGAAQGASKAVVNFNTTVAGTGGSPAKGIADITNVINGAGTAATKTSNEIKKVTNQPTGKFFSQFNDGLKGLINNSPKATNAIQGIGTAGEGIINRLPGATKAVGQFIQIAQSAGPVGLAAAAAVAAFAAAVAGFGIAGAAATKIFSENEKRTEELRKKTTLAAASAMLLDTAFRQTGQTTENLTKVVNEFQLKLDQARAGSEKATAQFKQIGIDPTQFNNVDEALKAVIERLNELPADAESATKAIDLLGTEGFASLKDAAVVIEETQKRLGVFEEANNKARAQLAQFDRALSNARISFDGLAAVLAAEVLPAFTEVAQSVDELFRLIAESEEVRKVFRVLSDALLGLVIGIKEAISLAIEFKDALFPVISTSIKLNEALAAVSGGFLGFKSVADAAKFALTGLAAAASPVLTVLTFLGQLKTTEKRIELEEKAAKAQKKSAQAQVEAIKTVIDASQAALAMTTELERAKRAEIDLTTQAQLESVKLTIAGAAEQAIAIAKILENSQKEKIASFERDIAEVNKKINEARAKGAGESQLTDLLKQLKSTEEALASERLKLQQVARENQQKIAVESEKADIAEIAAVRAEGLAMLSELLAKANQGDIAALNAFNLSRLEIERKALESELAIRQEKFGAIAAAFGKESQQALDAQTRILELRKNLADKTIEIDRATTEATLAEQTRRFTEIERLTSEQLDKISQKNFKAAERDRALAAKVALEKIEIERKALIEKIKIAEAELQLIILREGGESEAVKRQAEALRNLRQQLRDKELEGERAFNNQIETERERGLETTEAIFQKTTQALENQLKQRKISQTEFDLAILKAEVEAANQRVKTSKQALDAIVKLEGEASDKARAANKKLTDDETEAARLARALQLANAQKLRDEEQAAFNARQTDREIETQTIQDNLARQEELFNKQKITEQQISQTRLESVIKLAQIQSDAAAERVKEAEQDLELARQQAAARDVIIEKEAKLRQARADAMKVQMQGIEAIMKAEEMAASQSLENGEKFLRVGEAIANLLNKIADEAKVTFSPENFDADSIANANQQLKTFKARLEEIDKANLTLGVSSIRTAVRDIFENSVVELQEKLREASINAARAAAQSRIDAERAANAEILSQLQNLIEESDRIRRESARRQREIQREIGKAEEDRIKQTNKIEDELNKSILQQITSRIEAQRRATIAAAQEAAREQLRINQDTQRQLEADSANSFQADRDRIKANSDFERQLRDLEARKAKATTKQEKDDIDAQIQKLKNAQTATKTAADENQKAQDERNKAVANAQLAFNKEFEEAKTKEEKDAAIARFNAAVKAADDRLAAEQAIIQDILQARINGDKEAEEQLKQALQKRLEDIEAAQEAEIKRIQDTANLERRIRDAQAKQEEQDFQESLDRQRKFAAQQIADLNMQADMRLMALEMALEKERRAEERSLRERQRQLAEFLTEQARQLGLAGQGVTNYIGSVLTSFGVGIDKVKEFLAEVKKINQATEEAAAKVNNSVGGNPFGQTPNSGNNSNTTNGSNSSNSFGSSPDSNSNATFNGPNSAVSQPSGAKPNGGEPAGGKVESNENGDSKAVAGKRFAKPAGNTNGSVINGDKKASAVETKPGESTSNGGVKVAVAPVNNVTKTFNFSVNINVQAPNLEGRQLAQAIAANLDPRIRNIALELINKGKETEERQNRQQQIGELGALAFLPSELI